MWRINGSPLTVSIYAYFYNFLPFYIAVKIPLVRLMVALMYERPFAYVNVELS